MNPLFIAPLAELAKSIINRIFPDPAQKAAAELELAKMVQTGELAQLAAETDLAKLQIQTNIEEAKSTNIFVAGWRPAIGWVCALGLGWNYIGYPIAVYLADLFVPDYSPIGLASGDLLTLALSMLGVAGLRTWEKTKGIA